MHAGSPAELGTGIRRLHTITGVRGAALNTRRDEYSCVSPCSFVRIERREIYAPRFVGSTENRRYFSPWRA
jgi:hypothetical protein